jgi:hypothetical protein
MIVLRTDVGRAMDCVYLEIKIDGYFSGKISQPEI